MKRYNTQAIILRRVDYGEADRVITFLTPTHGKIAVIAKGVRREKSRLAGGIELFSESDISIVEGRGSLGILASARLKEYFKNIVSDYGRVTAGYQVIKYVNDLTEDDSGSEFYELLRVSLESLNDLKLPLSMTEAWYKLNIMKLMGTAPNLSTDSNGSKLSDKDNYTFDIRDRSLTPSPKGSVTAEQIKSWRLLLSNSPSKVRKVQGAEQAIDESSEILEGIFQYSPGA